MMAWSRFSGMGSSCVPKCRNRNTNPTKPLPKMEYTVTCGEDAGRNANDKVSESQLDNVNMLKQQPEHVACKRAALTAECNETRSIRSTGNPGPQPH